MFILLRCITQDWLKLQKWLSFVREHKLQRVFLKDELDMFFMETVNQQWICNITAACTILHHTCKMQKIYDNKVWLVRANKDMSHRLAKLVSMASFQSSELDSLCLANIHQIRQLHPKTLFLLHHSLLTYHFHFKNTSVRSPLPHYQILPRGRTILIRALISSRLLFCKTTFLYLPPLHNKKVGSAAIWICY